MLFLLAASNSTVFLYCIAFEMIGRFWYQLMVTIGSIEIHIFEIGFFRIRNTFVIRSTVLLTNSVLSSRIWQDVKRLDRCRQMNCTMRELETTRTRSPVLRYILNLQAKMKCRKNPLRCGYPPSNDDIHFLLEVNWPFGSLNDIQ